MRKLTSDEKTKLQRAINVEAQTATCVHTVKAQKDDPYRLELTWVLNFTNCTPEQLLELAARSALIDAQRVWRADTTVNRENEELWDNRTLDVALAMNTTTRRAADPVARAERDVAKMTNEQRNAFIKKLTEANKT